MPEKQNKTERVEIRLSPEERRVMEEYAAKQHLKLSQLIRQIVLQHIESQGDK